MALDSAPSPSLPPRPRGQAKVAAALGARRWRIAAELRVLSLVTVDLLSLGLACTVAYLVWVRPMYQHPPDLYYRLSPMLLLFALGYAQAGLYPGFGLGPPERLRRYSYVTLFVFLVLASFNFTLKLPHQYPRVAFGIAVVLSLVLVPLLRTALLTLATRWRWWREPVAVVASDDEAAARLLETLSRSPQLGYEAVGVLGTGQEQGLSGGSPFLGGLDRCPELAGRGVRVALVAGATAMETGVLDGLHRYFQQVIVTRGLGGLPVEGAQVRNLGGILGIEHSNHLLRRRNRLLKRTADLLLGGVLLALSLPIMVAAAGLVRLTSRGPALFVQRRRGKEGREIEVPKIRTMVPDADRQLGRHLEEDPELRREWDEQRKLRTDPRLVPAVGRLLRRYSIDELPQLWSVVKGDMSLVGPRPLPDYHLGDFSAESLDLRQRVRPGLTGLWQVSVRSGGVSETETLDSYYIRNWSLWLDLYVLARTVGAVLSGRGAY